MKKSISVLMAAALLALAAAAPASAGSAARHRAEGAALAFGGLYVLGGRFPFLPSFIQEPLSLMTLGIGSDLHRRLFYHGYRPGYRGYFPGRHSGYDRPYLGYSSGVQGYQAGTGSYTTQVWVPGKNTPQGYVEGYWEVRGIGGPSRYAANPSD